MREKVGRNESQMSTGLAPVVVRSSPESSIILKIRSGFFLVENIKGHTHTKNLRAILTYPPTLGIFLFFDLFESND